MNSHLPRLLRLSAAAWLLAGPAAAAAEPGARTWLQCRACHTLSADEPQKTGPTLAGLFGRTAGKVPGFRYSAALANSDVVWDEQTLDAFLANPFEFFPGNAMAFTGIGSAGDRAALLDYLKTRTQ